MFEGPKNDDEDVDDDKEIVKKVASQGPEWVERRVDEQEGSDKGFLQSSRSFFGHSVLSSWETINRQGENWEKIKKLKPAEAIIDNLTQTAERTFNRDLPELQREMSLVLKNNLKGFKDLVESYVGSLDDESLKKLYEKHRMRTKEEDEEVLGDLQKDKPDVSREKLLDKLMREDLWTALFGGYYSGESSLDAEDLIPMLRKHAEDVLKAEKEIQEDIERYKEKIRGILLEASDQRTLPISPELINERLDTLKFKVIDGLTASLDETWGDFISEEHTIRFSTEVPKDKLWSVFVHEVMHALSGQIENSQASSQFEQNDYLNFYDQIKIGMHFNSRYKKNLANDLEAPNLRWLNEAITEKKTIDLTNEEESSAYRQERRLLNLLIRAGVPEELLLGAYFENYDTNKPSGEHRLPKTKALFDFTNEKFGNGFLVNLDRFIDSKAKNGKTVGVSGALLMWTLSEDDFPQMISDWAKENNANNKKSSKEEE